MSRNYLISIVGPTGIGKTSLSIKLAQHFQCDIISCDSRQFYKEMQIGTAAPTAEELASAPHHFIHNKSIHEEFTVGDFEREAIAKLDVLFKKNPIQIMVGGSGLYVNAVLEGFDSFPDIDVKVREEVQANYQSKGLGYLREQLALLDEAYYDYLEENNPQTLLNPQRLMRFVEVCIGSGEPYSSFLNKKNSQRNFTPIVIGLEAERDIMYNRINTRVDNMMQQGLLLEVNNLFQFKHLNALNTVGYKELFVFAEGNCDLPFAISEVKKNTRRFAKRQLTWFKRNEQTQWFDFETPIADIIQSIQSQMNE